MTSTMTKPKPSTVAHLLAVTNRLPDGAGVVLSSTHGSRFGRCWDHLVTADNVPDASAVCFAQSHHEDVYVSVTATDATTWADICRRSKMARGGVSEARWLYCLWADLDVAGPGHANCDGLPLTFEAAELIYADLPTPTLVINSSGGLHVWWLLEVPVEITDDTREDVTDLATGWQQLVNAHAGRHGYRSDNVDDLARVLRVCGTMNRKPGLEPKMVTLHSVGAWPEGLVEGNGWTPGPLHAIEHLADLVARHRAEHPPPEPERPKRAKRERTQEPPSGRIRLASTSDGDLNILDAVDAADWSDIWPDKWDHVGYETVGSVTVELWRRPGAKSACSAKCWPDGGAKVWSDSIVGLPAGEYSKADVLAWRFEVDLSDLARLIIDAGRSRL